MAYLQPPPSPHRTSDVLSDVAQENNNAYEGTTNDEVYNQSYYMRRTDATHAEIPHSTTFDSSVDYTINNYDSGAPHDGRTVYSQAATAPQLHLQLHSQPQLHMEPQPHGFHPAPWNFQDVSNEFASLATSSHEVFQQSQQDYFQDQYVFWEETTIPDGAMFPIDIPLYPDFMDAQQQSAGSEIVADAPLSTLQQGVQPIQAYFDPIGGETLVPPPVRYDDEVIPRNDPSWLLKPQKHPWVQSGRAYLCPYDICQVTIIQKKNRRRHNAVVHGVEA